MEFKIEGEYPVLRVFMNRGESVVCSAGAMSWMTPGIEYNASAKGGLLKGLGRAMAGESMFQNKYTSNSDGEEIAFASSLPGKIIHVPMQGNTIMTQRTAFLASTEDVSFEIAFQKKISTGLLGGEGFVLQKFTGHGDLFLEADGSLVEYELGPGERMLVDQGNVFMFDSSVSYEMTTVKGLKNMFFGGEGAFLVNLVGPGKITLQTMPIANLAARILPFVPNKK